MCVAYALAMRLAIFALFLAACGGSTSGVATTSNTDAGIDAAIDSGGGGDDAGDDGGTTDSIWPADATKLAADAPGGGFTPTPPPGSDCKYGEMHYTLDPKTHDFTFDRCAPGATNTDPLQRIKGTRTLSTSDQATVEAAMKKLTIAKNGPCGADKGELTVTVTTPRGTNTYYDSFYVCNGGGKTYVDNIDDVFSAFGQLAPIK